MTEVDRFPESRTPVAEVPGSFPEPIHEKREPPKPEVRHVPVQMVVERRRRGSDLVSFGMLFGVLVAGMALRDAIENK